VNLIAARLRVVKTRDMKRLSDDPIEELATARSSFPTRRGRASVAVATDAPPRIDRPVRHD
jgi:hypothetical protein